MLRSFAAATMALCFLSSAKAQTTATTPPPPDIQTQPVGTPPDVADMRGVNIRGTLNPQPPTSTTSQVTTSAAANSTTALGFNTGAVTILPAVTAATYYDDNVFALPVDRLGDLAFVLRPEFSWRSNNWSNIDLGGNAYIEGRKYVHYDSEDQLNGGASIGGTAQINADTQVVGRMQYVHGHEDRGVSDTITDQFNHPIAFDQGEASAALNNRWDRIWTSIGAAGLVVHYDDASLSDGTVASQAYRSGNIERVPARIGYVVAPLTSVFVEASGNRRDFEVSLYDSLGYRVVGGFLFEPGQGARVRGEVFAGFMEQSYNGPTFRSVSTWTGGGSMSFLLTDPWTVTLEGRRDPREASLSGGVFEYLDGVSVIESVATARTDYHVLPNFVVGAGISYIQDHFLDAARTDWAWSPLASAKYFVTPRITLGFDYRHVGFESSGLGIPAYTRNVYLLSANAKF